MSVDRGNALHKPRDGEGKRDFNHGLCSCFGACGTTCFAFCCPCIVHGKNKARLRHLTQHNSPDPEGGSSVNGDCIAHCILNGVGGWAFILQMLVRRDVRDRYRIRGNGCTDCLAAYCCQCCELVQESRELEDEERTFGQQHQ
ncbi:PLAC8-domain-containing protein [Auriscalpium vulgare]|uniref:PLAC8-domain-containing protein n=1 Tax=Auriscalpium vulgare TaxID=40419 RepID=A0ACB8S9I8_9AGAM|nr:PLAC8-domain-containing protein [Auriscalpium vulgare]